MIKQARVKEKIMANNKPNKPQSKQKPVNPETKEKAKKGNGKREEKVMADEDIENREEGGRMNREDSARRVSEDDQERLRRKS